MISPTMTGAAACLGLSKTISVGILSWLRQVKELAAKKGCSPAQFALAWVLAQGNDIVPIPGTKRRKYLEENIGALAIHLTPEELVEINAILPAGAAAGSRYSAPGMRTVNR